jgi:hypothetical protein
MDSRRDRSKLKAGHAAPHSQLSCATPGSPPVAERYPGGAAVTAHSGRRLARVLPLSDRPERRNRVQNR